MANPRQRRKMRSSSHKPVKQSRRANKLLKKQPPIKGPKVLQEAWNKHKTVRQNYAALGLAHSLRPTDTGGRDITQITQDRQIAEASPKEGKPVVEKKASSAERRTQCAVHEDMDLTLTTSAAGNVPAGFGKIIRDETGAVVDIELAEDEIVSGNLGGKTLESKEGFEIGNWNRQPERENRSSPSDWLLGKKVNGEEDGGREDRKEVIRALEQVSGANINGSGKQIRTSSAAETKYLSRLVEAHGVDYEGMARDRKRNTNQYTAGQLRRAVGKALVTPSRG